MDPLTQKILARAGVNPAKPLLPPVYNMRMISLQKPLSDAEITLHNARRALKDLVDGHAATGTTTDILALETGLRKAMDQLERKERACFQQRYMSPYKRVLAGWTTGSSSGSGSDRTGSISAGYVTEEDQEGEENTAGTGKYGLLEVRGDGNCLFRSMAHLKYGDEEQHWWVRQEVTDYMTDTENAESMEQFQPDGFAVTHGDQEGTTPGATQAKHDKLGSIKSYAENMAKDGVWGTSFEIDIMRLLYEQDIVVVCRGQGGHDSEGNAIDENSAQLGWCVKPPTIYDANRWYLGLSGNHYRPYVWKPLPALYTKWRPIDGFSDG